MFILKNRTIGSRTLLAMTANNIHNLNGLISAQEVTLDAAQDIKIGVLSGTIGDRPLLMIGVSCPRVRYNFATDFKLIF